MYKGPVTTKILYINKKPVPMCVGRDEDPHFVEAATALRHAQYSQGAYTVHCLPRKVCKG